MNNRHQRRVELNRYRGLARGGLVTWLADVRDPLRDAPLLQRTRDWWLNALPAVPMRKCLDCKAGFWCRDDVGALLYSSPALNGIGAGSAGGMACAGRAGALPIVRACRSVRLRMQRRDCFGM